ncbi:MAG: hypothetical protein GYA14_14630 [Ignavibacteria bacterium]|nr:hypothetical protein [Ignavibacteria bacterium]
MAKNKQINLLPQDEFEASIIGRTLKWAMGTFRIIVITTEMIVMAAFLSRFWLDAQNSELSNSIKIASSQISAQSAFENAFRSAQKKINIIKQISSSPQSAKLDYISGKIPDTVTLSSINLLADSAQVKGTSVSEMNVAQFIANLKTDKSIKKVDLESIGSSEKDQTQVNFLINITY